MPLTDVFFDLPGELEPGPSFEADSFGGRNPVTKQAKVRESARLGPPETSDSFDDTFQVTSARLREGAGSNAGKFARGVPTNDKTSSTNYPDDNVKIIDGEHKTLMDIGRISEAMEDDDHTQHILKHRLQLADPKLSYSQRESLQKHIETHVKANKKKMKEIAEATGKQNFKPGLGIMSRAKPATTTDVIPQDSMVDNERKRTAGNMSMESKMGRFDKAVARSYGGSRRGL